MIDNHGIGAIEELLSRDEEFASLGFGPEIKLAIVYENRIAPLQFERIARYVGSAIRNKRYGIGRFGRLLLDLILLPGMNSAKYSEQSA